MVVKTIQNYIDKETGVEYHIDEKRTVEDSRGIELLNAGVVVEIKDEKSVKAKTNKKVDNENEEDAQTVENEEVVDNEASTEEQSIKLTNNL